MTAAHLARLAGPLADPTRADRGWITRIGSGRAVRVTPAGARGLTGLFGRGPEWCAVA